MAFLNRIDMQKKEMTDILCVGKLKERGRKTHNNTGVGNKVASNDPHYSRPKWKRALRNGYLTVYATVAHYIIITLYKLINCYLNREQR